jgi:hypothetical protein
MLTDRAKAAKLPEAKTFDQSYPGMIDQVRIVRADLATVARNCPVEDDLIQLMSELATNAILRSRSGHPDRMFTVRAYLYPGDYAWVEVADLGDEWTDDGHHDEHGRGLAIVAAVTGDGNWDIAGNTASRVASFRPGWPRP